MSTPPDDDRTAVGGRGLVVLYADISGSTKLYEDHGDAAAREATAECVRVMSDVVAAFDGRVVKTIGDEVMAVFHDPARGAMAGTDVQGAVRRAGEEGRFATGPLRIKVGLHYGHGLEEESDVFGEAPIVAQAVIGLAKADQTLTSRATLDALPPMLRMNSRFVDRVHLEGSGNEIDVFEMIWEVTDLTQTADSNLVAPRAEDTALLLEFQGVELRCDAQRPLLGLGRVEGNDLVVPTDLTSRRHAEIELRHGRFRISDNSANGTVVVADDGTTTSLRREHATLRGSGRICLGGTPETNPGGMVRYRCE